MSILQECRRLIKHLARFKLNLSKGFLRLKPEDALLNIALWYY